MNNPIKAIETRYKGYRFRSRLEARWAVFFDALGIEWQYEPEGFELATGRYLPDFYLPGVRGGIWVEVKGTRPSPRELAALESLVMETKKEGTFRVGEPMLNCSDAPDDFDNYIYWPSFNTDGTICADGPYLFCVCLHCGKVGFEFDGRGDRVCGGEHVSKDGDKGYSAQSAKITAAALAARGARFEHEARP